MFALFIIDNGSLILAAYATWWGNFYNLMVGVRSDSTLARSVQIMVWSRQIAILRTWKCVHFQSTTAASSWIQESLLIISLHYTLAYFGPVSEIGHKGIEQSVVNKSANQADPEARETQPWNHFVVLIVEEEARLIYYLLSFTEFKREEVS